MSNTRALHKQEMGLWCSILRTVSQRRKVLVFNMPDHLSSEALWFSWKIYNGDEEVESNSFFIAKQFPFYYTCHLLMSILLKSVVCAEFPGVRTRFSERLGKRSSVCYEAQTQVQTWITR